MHYFIYQKAGVARLIDSTLLPAQIEIFRFVWIRQLNHFSNSKWFRLLSMKAILYNILLSMFTIV